MLLQLHKNYHQKLITKIILLIISFLFFGILYYLICKDSDFGGINLIQQQIREKIINKLAENIVKGKQINKNKKNVNDKIKSGDIPTDNELKDVLQETEILDEKSIKKIDKKIEENIEKSPNQKLFDRIYFSIVTGSTLGYGDIYPISNKSKIITISQLFITLIIIIY